MTIIDNRSARLATLNQLLQTVIPEYLTPAPSAFTLRVWFDKARIARFKSNPTAKRGGGPSSTRSPGWRNSCKAERCLADWRLRCRMVQRRVRRTEHGKDGEHYGNNAKG